MRGDSLIVDAIPRYVIKEIATPLATYCRWAEDPKDKAVRWDRARRILWTNPDGRVLFLAKVQKPISLEILPKHTCSLRYIGGSRFVEEPYEGEADAEFSSMMERLGEYKRSISSPLIGVDWLEDWADVIRHEVRGRVTLGTLKPMYRLPVRECRIHENGIRLLTDGTSQALVPFRKIKHYRRIKSSYIKESERKVLANWPVS